MEEMVVDKRFGFFVNHDLAGYEVPVHADIPHLEVMFVDEVDPAISPVKAKGIGELGLTGVHGAHTAFHQRLRRCARSQSPHFLAHRLADALCRQLCK